LADYTQAIKLNPNHALAYGNRGIIYRQLGDINKAKETSKEQHNYSAIKVIPLLIKT
jgi:Flp pilus assembly protein TadD